MTGPAAVLALACASTEQFPLRPCGERDGRSWIVKIPPGQPATPVLAQVDLANT